MIDEKMKMEFYDVINRRRCIRQFEDCAISKDVLERILAAALKVPSSNHQRQDYNLTVDHHGSYAAVYAAAA